MINRRDILKKAGLAALTVGAIAPKVMARELELFSRTSPNTLILGSDEKARLQALEAFHQKFGAELDHKVIKHDLFQSQNSSIVISKLEVGFKKECYLMQADPANLDQQSLNFLKKNFNVIYV